MRLRAVSRAESSDADEEEESLEAPGNKEDRATGNGGSAWESNPPERRLTQLPTVLKTAAATRRASTSSPIFKRSLKVVPVCYHELHPLGARPHLVVPQIVQTTRHRKHARFYRWPAPHETTEAAQRLQVAVDALMGVCG